MYDPDMTEICVVLRPPIEPPSPDWPNPPHSIPVSLPPVHNWLKPFAVSGCAGGRWDKMQDEPFVRLIRGIKTVHTRRRVHGWNRDKRDEEQRLPIVPRINLGKHPVTAQGLRCTRQHELDVSGDELGGPRLWYSRADVALVSGCHMVLRGNRNDPWLHQLARWQKHVASHFGPKVKMTDFRHSVNLANTRNKVVTWAAVDKIADFGEKSHDDVVELKPLRFLFSLRALQSIICLCKVFVSCFTPLLSSFFYFSILNCNISRKNKFCTLLQKSNCDFKGQDGRS